MRRSRRFPHLFAGAWFGVVFALTAATAAAQPRRLTLEDAMTQAAAKSAALDVARAGESRADADLQRAKSQRFPQVNFAGSYDRTLASEFSSAFESLGPPCAPLAIDPALPLSERIGEIERAASCGALGQGFNFSSLPFGQRNVYRATFSFAQALYAGGRIQAQQTQAELGRRVASLGTSAAEAQLMLDVSRAYFAAALTDRLLTIAEAGERQAEAAFQQARLSVEAGRQPEFEMLRAQVTRDNQRPIVIRRRADRDLAYLRLRQLLELPPAEALVLDVDLEAERLDPPAPFAAALIERELSLTDRAGTRQAEALVGIREAGVTIAQSARKPSVTMQSSFGRVGYPANGAFPGVGDFRTNWTLGAAVTVPIFTGFRLVADELAARADLAEAQARLEQAKEAAELEAASADQDLSGALAVWQASASVVAQAQRAYEIAELRYREGISTQLELQDSRLAWQQAQANRAVAAHDVQIARARLALLPMLPPGVR
jgi:outer membrane protein TolC